MEIFLHFCRSYSTVPYFDTWEFFLVHRFVCIRSMALPNSISSERVGEAWPLCIFMVDWKKPESTSPSGEGEDCRVQAMTSFSLCAHGWPLVDNQFQSWHLRTTCSAQRGRGKKNWSVWVCGERNLTCIKLHLKFKKRSKSLSMSNGTYRVFY